MSKKTKEHVYFVKGMHCASCEVLIEKELLSLPEIKSVEASAGKGRVVIEYEGGKPSTAKLNDIFKRQKYLFFDAAVSKEGGTHPKTNFVSIIVTAVLIIGAFLLLNRLGLSGLVNVNSQSSLPAFFVFGILAGVSTCAALVGGLILSMSKQWLGIYSEKASTMEKLQPHLMFNIGRVASYAILGAVLGFVGSKLQISLRFTSFLVIGVSIMMLLLALQMLGLRAFRKFQFSLPKSATRYIADESHFKGRYMPFLMGALTFFLPCGFTITTQGLALLSGNPIQGGLITSFFALGTVPALLGIGLSSIKLSDKPHLSYRFSKIAGILVLFFALFNINSQLNVLGLSSFNDLFVRVATSSSNSTSSSIKGLAPVVDGKQLLKMDASSSGYKPNYFKVKAGVPVRWEITDTGTSGCTNAVISNSLFAGQISLTPGQTSIKEFTPTKPGKYKFSCWMGMVSGIIEVVEDNGASSYSNTNLSGNAATDVAANVATEDGVIPSGAKGCGCGGGGGTCGVK